ncbi:MAG: heavy-metal-associated domain-containing protein [Bacteroidales bacterium]
MKTTIFIAIFAFIFGHGYTQTGFHQQPGTSEFKVYGNCGMCKARIEKAAKTDGVTSAVWDKDTKILKVKYQPSKIRVATIHKNIAEAGHDTEKEKASDETYNSLPACCHYKRRAADETGQMIKSGGNCCSKH